MRPDTSGMPTFNVHRNKKYKGCVNDRVWPGFYSDGFFTLGQTKNDLVHQTWDYRETAWVDDGVHFYSVSEPEILPGCHFVRYRAERIPHELLGEKSEETAKRFSFYPNQRFAMKCWVAEATEDEILLVTNTELAWVKSDIEREHITTLYLDGVPYPIKSYVAEPMKGFVCFTLGKTPLN